MLPHTSAFLSPLKLFTFLTCGAIYVVIVKPQEVPRELCKPACTNGGTCILDRNSNHISCHCPPGFTGDTCSQRSGGCFTRSDCSNHGDCTYLHCRCDPGYSGDKCQNGNGVVCKRDSDCNYQGRCNEKGLCDCRPGFYGIKCEVARELCNPPCNNGGTCKPDHFSSDQFTCHCPPGFTGKTCDQQRLCLYWCENGGTCVDGNCVCSDNYYGLSCEFEKPSSSGKLSCESTGCSGHGFCSPQGCMCYEGYSGDRCQEFNNVESYNPVNISYFYYIIAGAGVVAITLVCFVTRVACRRRIVRHHQHSSGRVVNINQNGNQAVNRSLVIVPISTTSNGINSTPPMDDLPPAYDQLVHSGNDLESGQIANIAGDLPPSYEEAMRLKEETTTFDPVGTVTETIDLGTYSTNGITSGVFRNETEQENVPEPT